MFTIWTYEITNLAQIWIEPMKPNFFLCVQNKTNYLIMILELVMGMFVMCTNNNFGWRNVTNNTLGLCC
jgi:hypothetical protein